MTALVGRILSALDRMIDNCMPEELAQDRELTRRARLFLISHFCGPFLGNSIPLYLLIDGFPRDYRLIGFFTLVTAFWIAPITLKRFGHYRLHAFVSVEHLILTILWACFCYGGVHSPFLPWMLTVPLLAFFYLSWSGVLRLALLGTLAANLIGFYLVHDLEVFPAVDLDKLQVIGLVSTVSAAIYVAMMALYYAKVLRSQVELEHEVAQHLATAASLQRAAESAVRAGKAKSDFVAKMSHELKQPLNAIIGYSELLLEEAQDARDPASESDLGNIRGAGKQLLALVNDVLDYSKAEAGRVELFAEPVDLRQALPALVEQHRDAIEAGEIAVEIIIQPACYNPVIDWRIVEKVLSQLLENAATHTRRGRITLSVEDRAADRSLVLSVADTGCGISPERLPHLFDVFDHAPDESESRYGGTGLGLPLSAKLADLLGGELLVTSTRDVGSRFVLILPPPTEAAPAPAAYSTSLAA